MIKVESKIMIRAESNKIIKNNKIMMNRMRMNSCNWTMSASGTRAITVTITTTAHQIVTTLLTQTQTTHQ